jgi:hypothetical protein
LNAANNAIASRAKFFIAIPPARASGTLHRSGADTVIIIAAGIQGQIVCRVLPRRCELCVGAAQTRIFPRNSCFGAFPPQHRRDARPGRGEQLSEFLTPVAKFKL